MVYSNRRSGGILHRGTKKKEGGKKEVPGGSSVQELRRGEIYPVVIKRGRPNHDSILLEGKEKKKRGVR